MKHEAGSCVLYIANLRIAIAVRSRAPKVTAYANY